MRLKRHKQFIKDFQKTKLTDNQFERLIACLNALRTDTPLPTESNNHSLGGNYNYCMEFHLGGDTLAIYLLNNQTEIILLRIGTHSQLFK